MATGMSRDAIFSSVQETLVEALAVDDDEVTEDATLKGDLGAESIDFLDIVVRLEKGFDIKIPRGELFPDDIFNNPDYVESGRMTEAGMVQLRKTMPHADFLDDFEQDPNVDRMPDLFTVGTIVNYIERKVCDADGQPAVA